MVRQDDVNDYIERQVHQIRQKAKGAKDAEDVKTMDEVFDKPTLLSIYKLMKEGVLDTVDFPISTGKEGNVFRITAPDGKLLALKVYRTSNSTFRSIARYIEGDPRFKGLTSSHRKLINAWCIKEFRNLHLLEDAGVRVPSPVTFHNNMLVMEYIGSPTQPAPMLRSVIIPNPTKTYRTILKYMRLAYRKAELVHGDLSEYNILMNGEEPVIIDVGQAMTLEHPNADDFLKRDIQNINRYFRSLDVKIKSDTDVLAQIKLKKGKAK
jgi:RIO kinase 1